MKKNYIVFTFLLLSFIGRAQVIVPDAAFKSLLLSASPSNEIAKNLSGNYFKIDTNSDGEIQFAEALEVSELYLYNSDAVSMQGISAFTNITNLVCEFSDVTAIDVTALTHLKRFYFRETPIASVALTNLSELEEINILGTELPQLDLTGLPAVKIMNISENQLTALNLTGVPNLERIWIQNENIQTLDFSNRPAIRRIECRDLQLTSLNVSGSTGIEILSCDNNHLTSLNLAGLTHMTWLAVNFNPLGSIDLTGLSQINMLQVCGNNLTNLDLTPVPGLGDLYCYDNPLTSLNLAPVPQLRWLGISRTNIAAVDLNQVPNLRYFVAEACPVLTDIDASMLPSLSMAIIRDNPVLESVNLKNGTVEAGEVVLTNNPELEYVCVDEAQLAAMQTYMNSIGMSSVSVNSYCSFTPGGVNYNISGATRFDAQNNGCDASDIAVPNLFFNISGASGQGSLISGTSGNYALAVNAGTHTMTPVLEHPQYFSVSPTSATFNFPTQASPAVRDYCLQAVGAYNDLEIVIIPITQAVPGFEQKLLIKYKNKGNTVVDGSILFQYAEEFSDFESSTVSPATQGPGQLTWNFQNFIPFESREITVTLTLNTPTEEPPLNSGDLLQFSAVINPVESDATVFDNYFTLQQPVINSFDPNDKTCLEGSVVAPDMIGKYVHYMVRFENNGTAPARNIVVKDMIDTSKFIVESLVPTASSHPFVTRISATNKVEFIFENINLPFDDANNDGFVAFKIKTKPTLAVGNSFSNSASIYFDFNHPIVTNTATTTIQALKTTEFQKRNFTVYPSPADGTINIDAENQAKAVTVNIYNLLGQRLVSVSDPAGIDAIDVAALATGNYIIEIATESGSQTQLKFAKR